MKLIVNHMMTALVDGQYGCLDAAAETINARNDSCVSKGTLSKRFAGQYGWPVEDIVALEDACGKFPVSSMLARRLRRDETKASGHLFEHAGCISKESGEAVAAVLSAQQSQCADDSAQAIKEIDEAIEALRAARLKLEQGR